MTMKNEGQNDAAQHETVLAAPDVPAAADAIDLADRIVTKGFRRLSELGGPDAAQVLAYDMAHAAAGVATARALLDYGAKGDLEARITCAFTADMLHDLSSKVFGREADCGVPSATRWRAVHSTSSRQFRDPDFLGALADQPGPRHLDSEMEMVADSFRSFATQRRSTPHAEHVHRTNGDVPEEIVTGLAELGAFGLSVPAEYGGFSEGGERRVHGDGRRHRGAVAGQPGDRRLADHPSRDPHPRPREGWHRGAEAEVAAEARDGRGDARRRGDRARLRQRRGRHHGHRHTRRRARPASRAG